MRLVLILGAEISMRLGAHMSIRGGFPCAVDRALAVEARALQLFVKSARQWKGRAVDSAEAETFRRSLAAAGLERHTLAHAGYLINLAAVDRDIRERSIRALRDELVRCASLGIPFLVLHPGSHGGAGETKGLERVARALDRVLAGRRAVRADGVTVLLETTAGQGSGLGYRFEQLAWILDNSVSGERLGICFDTCHVLAAGYEFRDAASFRRTFRELDRTVGLSRLRAFHLNDSRGGLASRLDRHEHIGAGELGLEPFRLLLDDRRFRGLPMVLETPKGDDLAEDRRNLAVLRSLRSRSRR